MAGKRRVLRIRKGIFILASPKLMDWNFIRSVVFLCEHTNQGSFGLILNHKTTLTLNMLINSVHREFPIFHGGPVEENSLHFLHNRPDLGIGGEEVIPGVFWGGNIEILLQAINESSIQEHECRLFVGYSGWGPGQLNNEFEMNAWFLRSASANDVFNPDTKNLWRHLFKSMGESYRIFANFPDDPDLN